MRASSSSLFCILFAFQLTSHHHIIVLETKNSAVPSKSIDLDISSYLLVYRLTMDSFWFGTSPTTVSASPIAEYERKSRDGPICLDEFIEALPLAVHSRKDQGFHAGSEDDPIRTLFERVRLDKQDWEVYAHFDASRHYTRNLIATDHVSYTLLLLCWNPGQESPIHDHPCDGCWMEVFQGQIQECRYRASKHNASTLECTQDKTFDEGGIVFIEDSQGLHKVGNPGTRPAVTMHLYSPPFQSCKIWLDETKKPSKSSICHYSEYGRLV